MHMHRVIGKFNYHVAYDVMYVQIKNGSTAGRRQKRVGSVRFSHYQIPLTLYLSSALDHLNSPPSI